MNSGGEESKKPEKPQKPPKTGGSEQPIPGRCGAKLKNTNPPRYCKKWPVAGRNRCRICGGLSLPPGPTHPRYQHGRTSILYPKGPIGDRIRQYLNDPDLLNSNRCVALIQDRWLELVNRLSSGESTNHWDRLTKAAASFQSANKKIQAAIQEQQAEQSKPIDQQSLAKLNRIDEKITAARKQASESLSSIMRLISEGAPEQERWRELAELNRELATLQRMESSRIVEQQQMLSPEQAVTLMTATLAAIAKHVVDPKVRTAVATDLLRIFPSRAGKVVVEGEGDVATSAGQVQVIDGKVEAEAEGSP